MQKEFQQVTYLRFSSKHTCLLTHTLFLLATKGPNWCSLQNLFFMCGLLTF